MYAPSGVAAVPLESWQKHRQWEMVEEREEGGRWLIVGPTNYRDLRT
jgi:hypothetical protein